MSLIFLHFTKRFTQQQIRTKILFISYKNHYDIAYLNSSEAFDKVQHQRLVRQNLPEYRVTF